MRDGERAIFDQGNQTTERLFPRSTSFPREPQRLSVARPSLSGISQRERELLSSAKGQGKARRRRKDIEAAASRHVSLFQHPRRSTSEVRPTKALGVHDAGKDQELPFEKESRVRDEALRAGSKEKKKKTTTHPLPRSTSFVPKAHKALGPSPPCHRLIPSPVQ